MNIIDTPGHFDFVAEVERSLSVLDGAIMVISAKEGVQSHTRVLFEALKEQQIPVLIFINKLDRLGADPERVIREIKRELTDQIITLSRPVGEGSRDVRVVDVTGQTQIDLDTYEPLCDLDDEFLKSYLREKAVSSELFVEKVSSYAKTAQLYPVFMGVGIFGLGIEALLDGIITYLPVQEYAGGRELSGIVYKITRDQHQQKSTYVRLYSGSLQVRDSLQVPHGDGVDKITRIQIFEHGKLRAADSVTAGDIGVITGLEHFTIGDVIGQPPAGARRIELAKPTLQKKVLFASDHNKTKVYHALSLMAEEDPLLDVELAPGDNEIYIKIFGEVQMEIITSLLSEQYGLQVAFSESTTIYRETPAGKGVAFANMRTRNNPFSAAIKLEVEPLPRGAGVRYISNVSTGYLTKSFQKAVEDAVYESCKRGFYGWEVTDLQVTLTDAVYDSVNSTPADFRNVTPMVFMEALHEAKTRLLEPVYRFELSVPRTVASKAIGDLQLMRAEILETNDTGETLVVKGYIPVDPSKDYAVRLASYTEGKGVFMTRLARYADVSETVVPESAKTVVNPMNRRKYLLEKANAIKGAC